MVKIALVVTQSRHAKRLFQLNLEQLGWNVITSANSLNAIKLVEMHKPAMILVDESTVSDAEAFIKVIRSMDLDGIRIDVIHSAE